MDFDEYKFKQMLKDKLSLEVKDSSSGPGMKKLSILWDGWDAILSVEFSIFEREAEVRWVSSYD